MQLRPSGFLGIFSVELARPLRSIDLAAGQGHGLEHTFATESRLMVWLPLPLPFGNHFSALVTDWLVFGHVNSTPIVSLSQRNRRHWFHYK